MSSTISLTRRAPASGAPRSAYPARIASRSASAGLAKQTLAVMRYSSPSRTLTSCNDTSRPSWRSDRPSTTARMKVRSSSAASNSMTDCTTATPRPRRVSSTGRCDSATCLTTRPGLVLPLGVRGGLLAPACSDPLAGRLPTRDGDAFKFQWRGFPMGWEQFRPWNSFETVDTNDFRRFREPVPPPAVGNSGQSDRPAPRDDRHSRYQTSPRHSNSPATAVECCWK